MRRAERLLEMAKPLVDQGELVQAVSLLQEAHSIQPDSGDILFRLAGLQYDLRRYVAARQSVTDAIRRTSDEWNYYLLLGLIEKDVSRLDESRLALRALQLNPNSADIRNQLGDVAMRQTRVSGGGRTLSDRFKVCSGRSGYSGKSGSGAEGARRRKVSASQETILNAAGAFLRSSEQ